MVSQTAKEENWEKEAFWLGVERGGAGMQLLQRWYLNILSFKTQVKIWASILEGLEFRKI